MRFAQRILLSAFVFLFSTAALRAQTELSVAQDLRTAVAQAANGSHLNLGSGTFAQNIELYEKELTIIGDGTSFEFAETNSIIYVDGTASLNLSGIELNGANSEQAAIYVNGGKLVLSDSQIRGDYQFAIYASAGSIIELDNIDVSGGQFGLYLVDEVEATINGARFSNIADASVNGIGAGVEIIASGLSVDGSPTAVFLRDRARLDLSQSVISNAPENGIYLDQGAALRVEAVQFEQTGTGVLALDTGDVFVGSSEFLGTTRAAVVVENATSVMIDWTNVYGLSTGASITGQVERVVIRDTIIENGNDDVTSIYLAHQGSTLVENTSVIGGSSGLFISGPRTGLTQILGSDFSATGFAAVTLQHITQSDVQHYPVLEQNFLTGEGSAVGLALDRTELAVLRDNQIIAKEAAALSFNQSNEIQASGNVIAAGRDQLMLGQVNHNFGQASAANITKVGVDFSQRDGTEVLAEMHEARSAAQNQASSLGQVIAVNNEGLALWGDAAIMAVLTAQNEILDLPIDGTPLELKAGTYWVAMDGVPQGQIELTAGGRVEFEIPDPVHPHFLFEKEGQFYRGKALFMRPKEEIAANAKARNVNHLSYEYYNDVRFAPLRSDLNAMQKVEILTQARELFNPSMPKAMAIGVSVEPVVGGPMARKIFEFLLGPIAHLGDLSDRDRILDGLGDEPSFMTDIALSAAALIEARFGVIEDSALVTRAMAVNTQPEFAFQMLSLAGTNGNTAAIEEILRRIHNGLSEQSIGVFPEGIRSYLLISQLDDPRVLEIMRAVWEDYRRAIETTLNDPSIRVYKSSMGINFYSMPLVMEYLAAYGTKDDYEGLNLPVAGFFATDQSIATLVTNPVELYLDYIGQAPRPEPVGISTFSLYGMSSLACYARERRTPEDRKFIEDRIYAQAGRYFNMLYGDNLPEHDWVLANVYAGIPSTYCDPTTDSGGARKDYPENLRIYDLKTFSPNWGARKETANFLIEGFEAEGVMPRLKYLAGMLGPEFLAATDGRASFDNPAGQALRLHATALDHRYRDILPDLYSNGAESRIFVTPLRESSDQAILSGRVDLRPILQDGQLRAGVRLRVAYKETNGLAAMISQRDVAMSEALDNAAFNMIKEIRLVDGEQVHALEFERSTNSGVHIFGLGELLENLASKTIEVELEVLEQNWVFQFPLYYGDFAFRQRSGL